jgi:hypothetical protein
VAERLEEALVEPEGGENEDPNRAEVRVGRDLTGGFEPVEARHADVHQRDVRPEGLGRGDRLVDVGGFADDVEVVSGAGAGAALLAAARSARQRARSLPKKA